MNSRPSVRFEKPHRSMDLARVAADSGEPLPPANHRLFRPWLVLAFAAVAAGSAIFGLMNAPLEIKR